MRVWRFNNQDYSYESAPDLPALLGLAWVREVLTDPGFHRLSIGTAKLRAPWDRDHAIQVLMAEYDEGRRWHVVGGLEFPELYDLPKWEPALAADARPKP
jgi:hypothetical protein